MGKPTICLGKNKGADQLRSNCEADQRLCFRYSDSTIPKFQASSSFLCLYRSVCVGPVRKPHCWFSHEVAHIRVLEGPIIILLRQSSNIFIPESTAIDSMKNTRTCKTKHLAIKS